MEFNNLLHPPFLGRGVGEVHKVDRVFWPNVPHEGLSIGPPDPHPSLLASIKGGIGARGLASAQPGVQDRHEPGQWVTLVMARLVLVALFLDAPYKVREASEALWIVGEVQPPEGGLSGDLEEPVHDVNVPPLGIQGYAQVHRPPEGGLHVLQGVVAPSGGGRGGLAGTCTGGSPGPSREARST